MADRNDERTAGEGQPWRRDRYGSRFDQDRTNYGSGWDRERGGYGRGEANRSFAPHDDAYHQHDDLHPDYVNWRDEQLRAHDRDYETWRDERRRQYDAEHRRQRVERPDSYGRTYAPGGGHNMSRGMRPQDVDTTTTGDYYRQTGGSFGLGDDQPSGRLEPGLGHRRREAQPESGPRGAGERFDEVSPQVRAATDGWDTRRSARDYEDRRWRRDR